MRGHTIESSFSCRYLHHVTHSPHTALCLPHVGTHKCIAIRRSGEGNVRCACAHIVDSVHRVFDPSTRSTLTTSTQCALLIGLSSAITRLRVNLRKQLGF